jgi:hypothetical protein
MSFLSVLTLIFIVLKLTEFIDWSWWLVLAPTMIQAVAMISTIIGLVVFAARKK